MLRFLHEQLAGFLLSLIIFLLFLLFVDVEVPARAVGKLGLLRPRLSSLDGLLHQVHIEQIYLSKHLTRKRVSNS